MQTQTEIPAKTQSTGAVKWLVPLFAAISFYSYGTALMDYFLVYPSRALVGEKEFVTYHALLEERIIPISVIPFAVLTLLNIVLLFFRLPRPVKRLVWASLICLLIDWISTAFVQIPMNVRLGEGKDLALIQQVMDTNWGRVVLESLQAVLAFLLMLKSLAPQSKSSV
ncbi:MAG: hypothetical protein MUD08_04750 [Cytophagales bacterium]|nr:hypothetical protein [Cytophagales bacterium]